MRRDIFTSRNEGCFEGENWLFRELQGCKKRTSFWKPTGDFRCLALWLHFLPSELCPVFHFSSKKKNAINK